MVVAGVKIFPSMSVVVVAASLVSVEVNVTLPLSRVIDVAPFVVVPVVIATAVPSAKTGVMSKRIRRIKRARFINPKLYRKGVKPFCIFGGSFGCSELDHAEDLVEESQKESDNGQNDHDRDHCNDQVKERRKE